MTRRWKAGPATARGWRVENAVGGGEADLYIYDAIDSWGGDWGVSASDVVGALAGVKAAVINVHLNSPGGDYFEGVAIRTALVSHPATVNVFVDGMAASAASVIATAGEHVVIAQGAQIMIHEARTISIGTADEFRSTADQLDRIGDDIAAMYASRAGGDVAEWRAAMKVETWFTAAEAVEAGLADEIAPEPARKGDAPPDADEPAAARAAARWVAAWQYPGRAAAPAPQTSAPADDAPPATAPAVAFDPDVLRNALKRGGGK